MNQQSHIAQHIEKFSSQEVIENRLRLRTSVEAIRYLAFQGCSFRGHDESKTSSNRGNFLELLGSFSLFSDEVKKVIDKAPRNASYTSPTIQKQILQVLSTKVKNAIREEIGKAKFCIIVDEARDESKKEQMSIVLRFVDKNGFVQERFFGVVHVMDTIASTLKEAVNIPVPDFDAQYTRQKGRARHSLNEITIGHHYKVDLFNVVIDSQLQELNNRFDDKTMELIILSSSLDPKEMRLSFRIDDICKLVEKFYPQDFEDHEILQLRTQFEHFDHVRQLPDFRSLESISDLCQWLVKTRKSIIYPLVYKVVTLILTLPVSTATTERSFSAMKLVKTTLRSNMEDEFLNDVLLVYIEREIAKQFSTDSIIDDFRDIQERRSKF